MNETLFRLMLYTLGCAIALVTGYMYGKDVGFRRDLAADFSRGYEAGRKTVKEETNRAFKYGYEVGGRAALEMIDKMCDPATVSKLYDEMLMAQSQKEGN